MTSLVLEIQRDALDDSVPPDTLLRKAKVAAIKLGAREILDWINSELEGYGPEAEPPNYRTVYGSVKAFNPYNGWIPVIFSTAEEEEFMSQRKLGSSIAELQHFLSSEGESIRMRYPPALRHSLMKNSSTRFEPMLIVSISSVRGILSRVRQNILNWALELEEKGVTGEG